MKSFTKPLALFALILIAVLPLRQASAQRLETSFNTEWVAPLPALTFASAGLTDSSFVVSGLYWGHCVIDTFNLWLIPGCATDGFLVRYGKDRKARWARRVGGTGTDRIRKIIPMPGGDFIIAGDFNSPSNYGGFTLYNYGLYDGVIARLDSNGRAKWVNKLGYWGGDDFANDIAMMGDSVLVVGGSYYGGCYFDSIFVAGAASDHAFVAGMDPNTGRWRWAHKMNGFNTDYVSCIATMPDTSIVMAGTFKGNFNIGNGGFANLGFGTDVWIAKLNKNRKFAWAKQIGGSADDHVSSVVGLPDGSVIVTVMARRTVKFIPGTETRLAQNDAPDIFLVKYSKTGRQMWIRQIGGRMHSDWGSNMQLNKDGNLSLSGNFSDTARFGPNLVLIDKGAGGFFARMDTGGRFFSAITLQEEARNTAYGQFSTHSQLSSSRYILTGSFSSLSGGGGNGFIGNLPYVSNGQEFVSVIRAVTTVTGTHESLDAASPLQAYPNPARDRVTVQSDHPMREPIILTDGLGRVVLRYHPEGTTQATLNTAHLPPGIYHLQCGKQVQKLALER